MPSSSTLSQPQTIAVAPCTHFLLPLLRLAALRALPGTLPITSSFRSLVQQLLPLSTLVPPFSNASRSFSYLVRLAPLFSLLDLADPPTLFSRSFIQHRLAPTSSSRSLLLGSTAPRAHQDLFSSVTSCLFGSPPSSPPFLCSQSSLRPPPRSSKPPLVF